MEHDALTRRTLEADLSRAIRNDEFELYYQPQIDMQTMSVCGAEALIRWNHPTRGQLGPDEFISMVETNGLVLPIGNWVLNAACMEAMHWPQSVNVAVNVSSTQFGNSGMMDVDLVKEVTHALQQSGLSAHRLELEMTETVIMEDVKKTQTVLQDLKNLGVTIAVDDFGTGYSSLQYLRSFQFDQLKIDCSFIRNIEKDTDAQSITRTIVELGKNLGISSIAEGVETQAQLDIIKDIGCNKVQGHFFAKPCSASEFSLYIQSHLDCRASGGQRTA